MFLQGVISTFLLIVRVSKPRTIFVNFIQDKILGKRKVYNLDNIDFNNGTNNEIPIGNLDERNMNRIRLNNFTIQPTNLEARERNSAALDNDTPDTSNT